MVKLTKFRENSFPTIGNIFENFFNESFFNDDFIGNNSYPKSNIKESKNSFLIELSIPGFNKDDIELNIDNDILSIKSSIENVINNKDENVLYKEFSYNSFERTFKIPENVNKDKINAKFDLGLLKITLPKKEIDETSSRLIKIE